MKTCIAKPPSKQIYLYVLGKGFSIPKKLEGKHELLVDYNYLVKYSSYAGVISIEDVLYAVEDKYVTVEGEFDTIPPTNGKLKISECFPCEDSSSSSEDG